MHGRAARPGALLGDEDAQDEVLAKVVVNDGPGRGEAGAAAGRVAPMPPLCLMSCWCTPRTDKGLKVGGEFVVA